MLFVVLLPGPVVPVVPPDELLLPLVPPLFTRFVPDEPWLPALPLLLLPLLLPLPLLPFSPLFPPWLVVRPRRVSLRCSSLFSRCSSRSSRAWIDSIRVESREIRF